MVITHLPAKIWRTLVIIRCVGLSESLKIFSGEALCVHHTLPKHIFLLLLLVLLADLVPGQPVGGRTCPKINTRKEWRQLSRESQASYLKAVKCLTTKPTTLRTRFRLRHYDDFQYVHSTLYMQGTDIWYSSTSKVSVNVVIRMVFRTGIGA
ncbi:hypothetical protein PSTG_05063 [Puccinia striiformis f. sp. tritici PST-78]|uniref:Uncharacterized protein n=1 Tax=Puccinia striiformis f. sp. tritici PST-78 TaxID=1165861 RepID=A0A0L0VQT0_9BASI|nr:hypothetical protein PSTG_05063 [Puccinia striiformis f. sp. tritici PST-78]